MVNATPVFVGPFFAAGTIKFYDRQKKLLKMVGLDDERGAAA